MLSRCLETIPSGPIRQAWRSRSGPISLCEIGEELAVDTAGQEPGQPRLAHAERQLADVLAVADLDIEGVELDLGIMPARVQAIEIGPPRGRLICY